MNYISHHEVAKQYNPEATTDFLLGSFVTDLARMAGPGTRGLLNEVTNSELQAGIRFHQLTNKFFDEQPQVNKLEIDMKDSFSDFLPWRAATQASRAGKDLLFDGIQFDEPRIIEDLFTTLDCVLANQVEFTGIDNPRALIEVVSWIAWYGPSRYDQVDVTARRLIDTLSRTRTPIPEESLLDVTRTLELHQPIVFQIGPMTMSQTVEKLKAVDQSL